MGRKYHLRKVRNKTSRKLDYILLGVILLVAAVLRLWQLGQVPFMHDEFSALFRLKFDNFRDLIQYGVTEGDSHPAGVQVFLYYWTKLVGWNELWVKLPFALMGIGSIFLIYVIGKQWFNSKVGLLAAAFFAVSQLTIFYSQLARPYSPGLFFVLLTTFFWNKILFDFKKPSVATVIGFSVSACLAALAHNFSTAQAGLIFLTGLFFLKKERRLAYWLGGIGALLLYSPHFPIFYYQTFVKGGIGGWLARPENDFLLHFLRYSMNYTPLLMFAMGVLIILPLILGKQQKRSFPIRWAAVAWFVIIFAIAFTYSLLREPIIQYSTLIFCYPFLVITCFSFYRISSMTKWQTVITVGAILSIGIVSLISNRQHFDLMYHQGYDQIAERMKQDNDTVDDIRFATFTLKAQFPEFYQAKTDVTRRVIFDEENHNTFDFRQWLENEESNALGFGWTDYLDATWETQAVAHYPWKLHDDTWFTSHYLTLLKDSIPGCEYMLHPLTEESQPLVNTEWSKAQYIYGDSIDSNTDLLGVIATIQATDTIRNCVLVMEIHDVATDSLLQWHGNSDESGILLPGTNTLAFATRFSPRKFPVKGKKVKTYVWDKQKGTLIVTRLDYYCTKFNSRLTGLYEPL